MKKKQDGQVRGSFRQDAQLYRLILDNTSDLISIHCLTDLSYEYANPATLNLLGYSADELYQVNVLELIHPEDTERVISNIKENLSAGQGREEFCYRKKDGEYVWLEVTGNIFSRVGQDPGVIIIARDITAHKYLDEALQEAHDKIKEKAQARTAELKRVNRKLKYFVGKQNRTAKELRESENYYEAIFQNTGTATVIVDKDLKITAANRKTELLTGYKTHELIGLNPFEHFVTPQCLPICQRNYALRSTDPSSAPQNYEIQCVNRQGVIKNVVINVARIPGTENQVVSIMDVTQQHQTRSLLMNSEQRFRTLFEQAPIGIAINRNGIIRFGNQAYAAMFGLNNADELIGIPVLDHIAPACRDEVAEKVRRRSNGLQADKFYQTTGLRRDGSQLSMLVQSDRIVLPDGPANVVFITDNTVQKAAEAVIRKQLDTQKMILEISKQFSNIISFSIDELIEQALKRIGEFEGCDRSCVFLFSEDGMTMSKTHQWRAEGIDTDLNSIRTFEVSQLPWFISRLHSQEYISIPRVSGLPPEAGADRDLLQAEGIRSLLAVPIITDGKITGFIGFDSISTERQWLPENLVVLETVAQLIAKGLMRKIYSDTIRASERYYRAIFENTGAPSLIIEEDGTIAMANEQCQRSLSYAPEELVGKSLIDIIPPQHKKIVLERHVQRRLDPEATPKHYDMQIIDGYGRSRDGWFQVDLIPGTKKSALTFVDLTDFRRTDRALRAISAINAAIVQADREQDLLDLVCQKFVEIGGYRMAWIGYLLDNPEQQVKPVADAGHNHGYTHKLNISLKDPKRNKGPSAWAVRSRMPQICRNMKTDPDYKPWAKDALRRGYKASISLPLVENQKAFGVINIYSDREDVFDHAEEKLLTDLAENLAFAISSLRTREKVKQTTRDLEFSLDKMHRLLLDAVSSLGTALDIKDPYTAGHQKRVVSLARVIAAEMGLSAGDIEGLTVAGNLHDLGKIKVPSEILNKPGRLSSLEFEIIKTHAEAGYDIVKNIEFPWPVAEIILQHHERMDGSGYPRGLQGEDILMEARIVAVADVVEAMASHRPYRAALGINAALEEVEKHRDILYDAEVVDACLRVFREKGFSLD